MGVVSARHGDSHENGWSKFPWEMPSFEMDEFPGGTPMTKRKPPKGNIMESHTGIDMDLDIDFSWDDLGGFTIISIVLGNHRIINNQELWNHHQELWHYGMPFVMSHGWDRPHTKT